jgi:quercetin dioxygenase-like cupin family protein
LVALGEKHWHGATSTTTMKHIAIQEALDGKPADWMKKVRRRTVSSEVRRIN